MTMLTDRDKLHLGYLAREACPCWGGHLERGEPITDPDMQRWIDHGLIEKVDNRGYVATHLCRHLLASNGGQSPRE